MSEPHELSVLLGVFGNRIPGVSATVPVVNLSSRFFDVRNPAKLQSQSRRVTMSLISDGELLLSLDGIHNRQYPIRATLMAKHKHRCAN